MSELTIKVTGGPDRKTHRYGPGESDRRSVVYGPQRGRRFNEPRVRARLKAEREKILAELGVSRPLLEALGGGGVQKNIQDQRSLENE